MICILSQYTLELFFKCFTQYLVLIMVSEYLVYMCIINMYFYGFLRLLSYTLHLLLYTKGI